MFSKIATLIILYQIAALSKAMYLQKASMPPECSNKNYCMQKSPGYPQELIDKLVEKGPSVDAIQDFQHGTLFHDLCEKEIYYKPIYEIVDENGTVRYVIQSESNDNNRTGFTQIYKMEVCLKSIPDPDLYDLESLRMTEYILTCEETNANYSFLVLSVDGTKTELAKVKGGIPVCCKCKVEESWEKLESQLALTDI